MLDQSRNNGQKTQNTFAVFCLFTVLMVPWVSPAKILLYPFGHCINSHLLNFEKLAGLLTEGGHNITMLVPSRYKGPYSNTDFSYVQLLKFWSPENISDICTFHSLQTFLDTPLQDIVATFYRSTFQYCDSLLSDNAVLTSLKNEKFDMAIYDAVDPCSRILADYVDVTFIVFHTQGIENVPPRHPAYLPSMLTTYSDNMALRQRVFNTIGFLAQKVILYMTMRYYTALRVKHQINTTLDLAASYDRASLRFILGDHALDYVGPMQPSHILIGGSISAPPKPIPQHMLNFMNTAWEDGVAILSFGSMVKYYGPQWREIFASALAKLPMKVIWRYNEEPPEKLGNNTMLVPWLPQAALLSHPNVRVFITHAGINAAFEAAAKAVPIVAIPLFGDQNYQATKLAEHTKMGVKLDVYHLTEDIMYEAIMKVGLQPSFRDNARRVSNILNTKPVSQRQQILHWVNYIHSLNGAPHLRSKEISLSWYQYLLLDVICIFVIAISILLYIIRVSVILIYCASKKLLIQLQVKANHYLKGTSGLLAKQNQHVNHESQSSDKKHI